MGCGVSQEGSVAEYPLLTPAAPLDSITPAAAAVAVVSETTTPTTEQQREVLSAVDDRPLVATMVVESYLVKDGKFARRHIRQAPPPAASAAPPPCASASPMVVPLLPEEEETKAEGLTAGEAVAGAEEALTAMECVPGGPAAKPDVGRRWPGSTFLARMRRLETAAAHLPSVPQPPSPPQPGLPLSAAWGGDYGEDSLVEEMQRLPSFPPTTTLSFHLQPQLQREDRDTNEGRYSPPVDLLNIHSTADVQGTERNQLHRLNFSPASPQLPDTPSLIDGEDYGDPLQLTGTAGPLRSVSAVARTQQPVLSGSAQRRSLPPPSSPTAAAQESFINQPPSHGYDMAFVNSSKDSHLTSQPTQPDLLSRASNVFSYRFLATPASDVESTQSSGSLWGHMPPSCFTFSREYAPASGSSGHSSLDVIAAPYSGPPTPSPITSTNNAYGLNSFVVAAREAQREQDEEGEDGSQVMTSLVGSTDSKERLKRTAGGGTGRAEKVPTHTEEEEEGNGSPSAKAHDQRRGEQAMHKAKGNSKPAGPLQRAAGAVSAASMQVLTAVKGRRRTVTIIEPPRRPSPPPQPMPVAVLPARTAPPAHLPPVQRAAAAGGGVAHGVPPPRAMPTTLPASPHCMAPMRQLPRLPPRPPQSFTSPTHFHRPPPPPTSVVAAGSLPTTPSHPPGAVAMQKAPPRLVVGSRERQSAAGPLTLAVVSAPKAASPR